MTSSDHRDGVALLDWQLWERIAAAIPSNRCLVYDLTDESHRLDVVQIVCEALAWDEGVAAGESAHRKAAGPEDDRLVSSPAPVDHDYRCTICGEAYDKGDRLSWIDGSVP